MNQKEKTHMTFFRHYTNVGAVFGILEKGLKFSEPKEYWEDLNDYFTLNEYRKYKQENKIYVLCFCDGLGSVHHWFYYGHSNGNIAFENCYNDVKCNIKLDKVKLKKLLKSRKLSLKKVKYVLSNADTTTKKNSQTPTVESYLDDLEKLPFIKRKEYEVEKEWRIVFVGYEEPEPLDIIDCIDKITILIDEDSPLYCLIKTQLISKCPQLKGKIDNNGVHKSKRWEEEITKVINNLNSSKQ